MLKTAVVILNWNGKELLRQFLPSVIEHSKEAEIYVIDNASADSSVAFLRVHYPKVKVILNEGNYGFAKGYNKGLEQIDAEVLVLLNSDVEVSSGWLNPIVHQFENELNTAIIQPKILSFHHKEYFEYAGAAGGFIDRFGFPFCRGRIFDTLEKDQQQYNDITDIFWASGACFAIRKKVFNELGGFDNDFFANGSNEVAKLIKINTQKKLLTSIAGGGDTAAAIKKAKAEDGFSYISTAGGAFLEWLEGKILPGLKVLEK